MTKEYYKTDHITGWPLIMAGQPEYAMECVGLPKDAFEAACQPMDAMSFGHALMALRDGRLVARNAWSDSGMWLSMDPPTLPIIGINTVDGASVPWTPTQEDMLADDWMELSEEPETQV